MKKLSRCLLGCVLVIMLGACGNSKEKETEKATEESIQWVTTWSQAQKGIGLFPVNDNDHTVEYQIPIQNAGNKIKLTLGNYYSEEKVKIASVSVSTNKEEQYQPVTVNGKKSFEIKAKGLEKTDPLELTVKNGDSVYVRIFYPEQEEQNRAVSGNSLSKAARRSVKGDFTETDSFKNDDTYADKFTNDPYASKYEKEVNQYKMRFTLTLEGIDVATKEKVGTIVAFGDSITEQNHWVAPLQKKITKELGENYSLVNAGISGNRLLKDLATLPRRAQYFGVAATDRFEHDVFEVNETVKSVIISVGVNDIHQPGTQDITPVDELPTVEEMVEGYEQLIKTAKKHDCKVYLATVTPFIGYAVDVKNTEKEATRQKINTWIRENKEIDGVVDFDKVLANATDPSHLNSAYDSGDKLHPNEVGGESMAEEVEVSKLK
ncbi:GDSL-type esterase/lipase family protein [Enterococcus faecalis]|uniref:GDSL-type esterase/lipase family protein n=1 Tax=Enterococcus faecalis TaxID=1351 RepID=UPI003CC5ED9E